MKHTPRTREEMSRHDGVIEQLTPSERKMYLQEISQVFGFFQEIAINDEPERVRTTSEQLRRLEVLSFRNDVTVIFELASNAINDHHKLNQVNALKKALAFMRYLRSRSVPLPADDRKALEEITRISQKLGAMQFGVATQDEISVVQNMLLPQVAPTSTDSPATSRIPFEQDRSERTPSYVPLTERNLGISVYQMTEGMLGSYASAIIPVLSDLAVRENESENHEADIKSNFFKLAEQLRGSAVIPYETNAEIASNQRLALSNVVEALSTIGITGETDSEVLNQAIAQRKKPVLA